jgi:hypothetical protein
VVRKILTLLLVLPLLQSPGFCLCRLFASAPELEQAADEAALDGSRCSPSCPCCRERAAREAATKEPANNLPVPEPQHSPGCPASSDYAINKAPIVDFSPQASEMLVADLCCPGVDLFKLDRPVSWPGGRASPDPSPGLLFLLCCNFRC